MKRKACSKCGEVKPLTEFNKGNGKAGGRSECRTCQALYARVSRNHVGWRGPVGTIRTGVVKGAWWE